MMDGKVLFDRLSQVDPEFCTPIKTLEGGFNIFFSEGGGTSIHVDNIDCWPWIEYTIRARIKMRDWRLVMDIDPREREECTALVFGEGRVSALSKGKHHNHPGMAVLYSYVLALESVA